MGIVWMLKRNVAKDKVKLAGNNLLNHHLLDGRQRIVTPVQQS